MIWAGWRLQRSETLVAAAILAAIAALLVPTGIEIAHAYHRDGLSSCTGSALLSQSCGTATQSFFERFNALGDLIGWLTLVPGLIGVMLAAPFTLELESGTYRFAWTQSITRRRWIAGKLGLAALSGIGAAVVLTLLMTWWRQPFVHLQGRLGSSTFDFEGTVVVGYVLLALGLAALIGAIWRRAVPALVVAFAVYFGLRIFVDTWLRQRLVAPLGATWKASTRGPDLSHAWVINEGPSDSHGRLLAVHRVACFPSGGGSRLHAVISKCVGAPVQGGGYMHAVYQPASHFWPLQLIETGLFAGGGLVLLAVAAWWAHERIA